MVRLATRTALWYICAALVLGDTSTCPEGPESNSVNAASGLQERSSPLQNQSPTYNSHLIAYAERHGSPSSSKLEERILLFHAKRTGLADRLLGMLSAFTLAFATDRTFVVSFGDPIERIGRLFQNPGWDWERDSINGDAKGLDLSWKVGSCVVLLIWFTFSL